MRFRKLKGIVVYAATCLLTPDSLVLQAQTLPPIAANDNTKPAGELRNGVLTLHLEMRKAAWHPEREDGETIPVYAFAESGKPFQDPGPTIRVPQGTRIDITIHSALTVPATLHGLHQRPGKDTDTITLAPGGTQRLQFLAGAPGTYLYWARTPDGRRGANRVIDSQLGGALVIDPPNSPVNDRIFVLERWNGPTRTAINGKSWPFTERLSYRVGEKVHWRIVNASDLSHPMHLHGFHFSLDAEGDSENNRVFDEGDRPEEFTHSVQVAETFDMTWIPTEPGRWLYHCHRIPHMRLPVPLDAADFIAPQAQSPAEHDHEHMHDMNSDYAGMGGMIMGLTITGPSAIDTTTNWKPERRLELTVGTQKDNPGLYELALRNLVAPAEKPALSTGLTGPVIVVTEKQPTEIALVSKMNEPTAIHWHGLEIESYYDGVPGYGGRDDRRSPALNPGDTFVVRMIPPRAGTFMYHTHWHDAAQLTGGIHGTLIVLPAGKSYQPETDKSFLFSLSPNSPFGAGLLLMNGSPQPGVMRLLTHTTYRFRFINITPTMDNLRVQLQNAGQLVEWRLISKDASDVKGSPLRKADQPVAVGETFDFEYRAEFPGELSLTGVSPNDSRRAVQTLVFTDR